MVSADARVLSSVVASQLDVHARYGGVVPELASREHVRSIVPVVRGALEQAGISATQLAAVAVTEGPGLVGSLLVGITYAKAMALALEKPLIAVNHVEGHIHAVLLEARQQGLPVQYPAAALVASGGHSHIFLMPSEGAYTLLGKTRDDAAGEAYDKVAKLLGFGYPGGPLIDQLAPHGDASKVQLPIARMKGHDLDLSFSGLKTAVLRWVEERAMQEEIALRKARGSGARLTVPEWLQVTPPGTLNLLAAFQKTIIEELVRRLERVVQEHALQTVIVTGGVAANRGLRQVATARLPVRVLFPTPALSTDNAAMIAAGAFPKWQRQQFASLEMAAKASLTLA